MVYSMYTRIYCMYMNIWKYNAYINLKRCLTYQISCNVLLYEFNFGLITYQFILHIKEKKLH